MTSTTSGFIWPWALSLVLLPGQVVAQQETLRPISATARVLANDTVITLTEQADANGNIDREFRRGAETLYRSRLQVLPQGFSLQVLAGHPSQLGTLRLERQRLSVVDSQGQALWTEELSRPLCMPEFIPEFVKAHWDRLTPGRDPLPCGAPIIKARKVKRL